MSMDSCCFIRFRVCKPKGSNSCVNLCQCDGESLYVCVVVVQKSLSGCQGWRVSKLRVCCCMFASILKNCVFNLCFPLRWCICSFNLPSVMIVFLSEMFYAWKCKGVCICWSGGPWHILPCLVNFLTCLWCSGQCHSYYNTNITNTSLHIADHG